MTRFRRVKERSGNEIERRQAVATDAEQLWKELAEDTFRLGIWGNLSTNKQGSAFTL